MEKGYKLVEYWNKLGTVYRDWNKFWPSPALALESSPNGH